MRLEELDLSRTRAFAEICEGNFCGIRLNLSGREPQGAVAPEEAAALMDELTARLKEWRVDDSRPPLVREVVRGPVVYPGPHNGVVSDLLVQFDPSVQGTAFPGSEVFAVFPQPFPDHDLYGVWIAAGPSIARREQRGGAAVFDVAPTALHLLGLPVYSEMTGVVRTELLSDSRPVRVIPESEDPTATRDSGHDRPFTEQELDELRERLGGLGYVQ